MRFQVSGFRFQKRSGSKLNDLLISDTWNLKPVHTGFVLIEALVASAIVAVVLAGVIGALLLTLRAALGNNAKVQSAFLAEEGLEAVRILRDDSWSANIATHSSGVDFYLAFDGTTWRATSTNAFIDNTFERAVVLEDVYRDGSHDITESGGTLDNNTKKITVSVSLLDHGATTTRALSTYLTNMFNN
ncbi:MAG TPA: hypothetical protein VJG64_01515 [Candidatus Paceibacterota bacterium]